MRDCFSSQGPGASNPKAFQEQGPAYIKDGVGSLINNQTLPLCSFTLPGYAEPHINNPNHGYTFEISEVRIGVDSHSKSKYGDGVVLKEEDRAHSKMKQQVCMLQVKKSEQVSDLIGQGNKIQRLEHKLPYSKQLILKRIDQCKSLKQQEYDLLIKQIPNLKKLIQQKQKQASNQRQQNLPFEDQRRSLSQNNDKIMGMFVGEGEKVEMSVDLGAARQVTFTNLKNQQSKTVSVPEVFLQNEVSIFVAMDYSRDMVIMSAA